MGGLTVPAWPRAIREIPGALPGEESRNVVLPLIGAVQMFASVMPVPHRSLRHRTNLRLMVRLSAKIDHPHTRSARADTRDSR